MDDPGIGNARGSPHRCLLYHSGSWKDPSAVSEDGSVASTTEWVDTRGMKSIATYIDTTGITGVFDLEASYDAINKAGDLDTAMTVNDPDANIITNPSPFVRVEHPSNAGSGTINNIYIYGVSG